MAAPSHPWFRHYNGTVTDRKLRRIALETGLERVVVYGVWCGLMELANASPVWGCLLIDDGSPLTEEEIAEDIGISIDSLHTLLEQFLGREMIARVDGALHLCNWDKRQFQSDSSTQRVREYRERKRREKEAATRKAKQAETDDGVADAKMQRSEGVTVTRQENPEQQNNRGTESKIDSPANAGRAPPAKRQRSITAEERRRNAVRSALRVHFSERTGIQIPKAGTQRRKKALAGLWWEPMRLIAQKVNWDLERGKLIIDRALEKLEGLTITDPNSILKTALALADRDEHGDSDVAEALARQQQRLQEDEWRFGPKGPDP